MSKLCSCIVPCFNEEEVIPIYYEEMQKVRKQEEGKIDFEIIFIDDGSKDKTLEVIKKLSEQDEWNHHLGAINIIYHFPETLEKKLRCMQDLNMPKVSML